LRRLFAQARLNGQVKSDAAFFTPSVGNKFKVLNFAYNKRENKDT